MPLRCIALPSTPALIKTFATYCVPSLQPVRPTTQDIPALVVQAQRKFHSGVKTCVLFENGQVKCWGRNERGQLGLGDSDNRGATPDTLPYNQEYVNLGTGYTATAIASGQFHTCALLDDGAVKCWGENRQGQLGLPFQSATSIGSKPDQMGDNLPTVDLGTGQTANAIAASTWVTSKSLLSLLVTNCDLLDNGSVKCWGENKYGELGPENTDTQNGSPRDINLGPDRRATAITCGSHHTCAILDNGSVMCWGWNEQGQLGLGRTGSQSSTMSAVDLGTSVSATSISAGSTHTCALLQAVSGTVSLKCWGNNLYGALGLEDTTNRGDKSNQMGDNLPPVSLGTGRTVIAIQGGLDHTCAILDNGSIKCWGDNDYGQLGVPVAMAANFQACVLFDNGKVKCWGKNERGQLGLGDSDNRGATPDTLPYNQEYVNLGTGCTATAIVSGRGHTCALLDDGAVKCWGENGQGQLGLPFQNATGIGSKPEQMGDNLPTVDLGTGQTAIAIAASYSTTCAILNNGSVKCWGSYPPYLGSTIIVDLGDLKVTAIAAGAAHNCALLDNGSVKCWGSNQYGQLGPGDTGTQDYNPRAVNLGPARRATAITSKGTHTCAILDNGSVMCWGMNEQGQLGLGRTGSQSSTMSAVDLGTSLSATSISAGNYHTCALLRAVSGTVSLKCWVIGLYGALGLGDTTNRGDKSNQMGDICLLLA
eukprot:gene25566-11216_t